MLMPLSRESLGMENLTNQTTSTVQSKFQDISRFHVTTSFDSPFLTNTTRSLFWSSVTSLHSSHTRLFTFLSHWEGTIVTILLRYYLYARCAREVSLQKCLEPWNSAQKERRRLRCLRHLHPLPSGRWLSHTKERRRQWKLSSELPKAAQPVSA